MQTFDFNDVSFPHARQTFALAIISKVCSKEEKKRKKESGNNATTFFIKSQPGTSILRRVTTTIIFFALVAAQYQHQHSVNILLVLLSK